MAYKELSQHHQPDELIFERMNRIVNVIVIWAVGAIIVGYELGTFGKGKAKTGPMDQVSPSSWKKYDRLNSAYNKYRPNCASDDEVVSILIGLYYLEKLNEQAA